MKKIRKPILLAITLVIVGLMIAGSASTAIQEQKIEKQTLIVNTNPNIKEAMDITSLKGMENLVTQSQIKIATPVVLGYHPAVASDSLGYVVLGFEDESPNVWFTASPDAGQIWAEDAIGWLIDPPPELPDVDSCGDGRFIGGMVPNWDASYGSELYKVECSNPLDFDYGYNCPYWEWYTLSDPTVHYYDFIAIAVAGYTSSNLSENVWAYGGHSIVGTYRDDDPYTLMEDIPMFSYQFDDTGYAWISRWSNLYECSSTAHDIDPETLYSFAAWNFNNSGDFDIFVNVMNFGVWQPYGGYRRHPSVRQATIAATGNDTYIDISALDNNVILVSQRDGDIVAYYSTNGMMNVDESIIETEAFNPRIVHNGPLNATCTFIKAGSVYLSTTEDGGVTWSTPEIIDEPENTAVPGVFKAADVCGYGAAWMNSDDGYIYYALTGAPPNFPPDTPTIQGETKLKPNKEFEFTFFTNDPDGDQVFYYIEWGDNNTVVWDGPHNSGVPVKLKHTWTTKDQFTIRCKAKDTNDLESGWAELKVSTPRTRFVAFRFLDYFPNAFPFLRLIFGF